MNETRQTPQSTWSPAGLKLLNDHFQKRPPADLLHWGRQIFGPKIVMGTGFGPSGVALMHMLAQTAPQTTIFYLDTDVLFNQTLALRDELAARLGLRFTAVRTDLSLEEQAATYGSRLWGRNPDLCCHLRKVAPLRRYLADKRAWITGVRRDQSPTRANTQLVEWNQSNGVLKLNPLAFWTEEQVWDYVRTHDLPAHPLHAAGYPSLGCVPCTRAVAPGEALRNGRWAGHNKLECGIHIENGVVQRVQVQP